MDWLFPSINLTKKIKMWGRWSWKCKNRKNKLQQMQVGTNRSREPETTPSTSHYTELQERNSWCDRYYRRSALNLDAVKSGWIISTSPSFHCYIQLQAGLRQSCFPYKNLQEMQEMGEITGTMLYILFTQLILLKSVEPFAYIWQIILNSFLMSLAWHEYTISVY